MENKTEFNVLLKACNLWRREKAKNISKDWHSKEALFLFLVKFSSLFYYPLFPVAFCIVNYTFNHGTLEFSWHYFTWFFAVSPCLCLLLPGYLRFSVCLQCFHLSYLDSQSFSKILLLPRHWFLSILLVPFPYTIYFHISVSCPRVNFHFSCFLLKFTMVKNKYIYHISKQKGFSS